ncbi:MAG: beta-ketoacyl reductase, partial [Gemmatimonadaceae bacterium]
FMDALAHYRRANGRVAVSIDWGAWSEVGAAVRHGVLERAAKIGVRDISPVDGLAILSQILQGSGAQVVALPVDWKTYLGSQHGRRPAFFSRVSRRAVVPAASREFHAATAPRETSDIVSQLKDAVAARRPALLRTFLRARVSRTLGLLAGQAVDDRQPLRDAGLDSLLAIELRNVLGAAINRPLPATLLFDYPTIDDLASHLLTTLFPDASVSALALEPVSPPESTASLMTGLSELSDDEVDRLLAAKRKERG